MADSDFESLSRKPRKPELASTMVNLLGVQKKEAVMKLVPVAGKESVIFWKIYDEYLQTNKTTAKARISLYEKTAMSYQNMTPAIADSLTGKYFGNRMDQEKSLEAYYNKIKTATNAVMICFLNFTRQKLTF